MKIVVWVALNRLRWLTVAAFIAWANPQIGIHWRVDAPAKETLLTRTIQVSPCPDYDLTRGRWYGNYICEFNAKAKWVYDRQQRMT